MAKERKRDQTLMKENIQISDIDVKKAIPDRQKGITKSERRLYHFSDIPFTEDKANACLELVREFRSTDSRTNAVDAALMGLTLFVSVEVPHEKSDEFLTMLQEHELLSAEALDLVRQSIG
jgi:hypothetical protein